MSSGTKVYLSVFSLSDFLNSSSVYLYVRGRDRNINTCAYASVSKRAYAWIFRIYVRKHQVCMCVNVTYVSEAIPPWIALGWYPRVGINVRTPSFAMFFSSPALYLLLHSSAPTFNWLARIPFFPSFGQIASTWRTSPGTETGLFLNVELSLVGLLKDIWLFSARACASCMRGSLFRRAGEA